jgi:hypothetical protein
MFILGVGILLFRSTKTPREKFMHPNLFGRSFILTLVVVLLFAPISTVQATVLQKGNSSRNAVTHPLSIQSDNVVTNVPRPIAPAGTIADTTPTYKWSKVAGATHYQYQLLKGTTSIYIKTISAAACGTTAYCLHTPTTVLSNSTYTWKVRTKVAGVWQAFSTTKTFAFATIPTPMTPTGATTDTTPTYGWSKVVDATHYQVQLLKGTTSIYIKMIAATACGVSTNCIYTPTTVLTAGTYTWKVRAKVAGTWKDYSTAKTFTLKIVQTLTVNKAGIGSGTITSAPVGIDCGDTCSYVFANNTVVTLTATPTSPFIFEGWSGGDCSGIETCTVTMNTAYTITAIFSEYLDPIVPDTTEILPVETLQYLVGISETGEFVFAQPSSALSDVNVGDVIVGDVSTNAPNGFLRKVTAINEVGGQTVVQTETTTLDEAIQQGEVHISQALTPSQVQSASFAQGVSPAPGSVTTQAAAFNLQITDVVLYDDDGDLATTDDQIVGNGSLAIEPSINFDMRINGWTIEQLCFTQTMHETADIKVESTATLANVSGEKELAHYELAPITVTIGFVPIVLKPILTFVAGVDGNISVSVSAGVTQESVLTGGVQYQNGTWGPVRQYTNQFTWQPPTLSSGLTLKGYVGPRLNLYLYGVVGPQIKLDGYVELDADLMETPWWKLYGGVQLSAGVRLDVLSHVVASYEYPGVIDVKKVLAQAATCSPGQTINDPANDVSLAHVDVTSLHSALNGDLLQATLYLRDVPAHLTFNRVGVPEYALEYEWAIYIDIDNNLKTGASYGFYQGAEYSSSALHFVFTPDSPIVQPIASGVQKNVWRYNSTSQSWSAIDSATLVVNTTANSISLTGKIPGINAGSRIIFVTYDYNPAGAYQSDLSACGVADGLETQSINVGTQYEQGNMLQYRRFLQKR